MKPLMYYTQINCRRGTFAVQCDQLILWVDLLWNNTNNALRDIDRERTARMQRLLAGCLLSFT